MRRLSEAIELLAPAGIVITPLDAAQATAVLASACNPDTLLPPSADLAGADEVITTAGGAGVDDDLTDTAFWRSGSGEGEFGHDELDPDDGTGEVDDWNYDEDDADYDERERS